jgi:hypothetical protein
MSATFYAIERKYQRKPMGLSLGSFHPAMLKIP